VKVDERKKIRMMDDRSPDIFDNEEERNEENIEEEKESEDDSEEEQEKEGDSSSSEEEGEVEDNVPDYDPWSPLRKEVGEYLKEPYMKEVQRFLDKGKTQDYAEVAAFNVLLPVSRRRLRRTYLQRLKWIHRIKHDAIHRKVMETFQRFIDEDDMDFDEAAESAVAKRKFLINRVMQKKLLPDEPNDDGDEEEEEVEEVEASV
jgi:hypothetical protein